MVTNIWWWIKIWPFPDPSHSFPLVLNLDYEKHWFLKGKLCLLIRLFAWLNFLNFLCSILQILPCKIIALFPDSVVRYNCDTSTYTGHMSKLPRQGNVLEHVLFFRLQNLGLMLDTQGCCCQACCQGYCRGCCCFEQLCLSSSVWAALFEQLCCCQTLPVHLPEADCSIFILSVGCRHVLLPLILHP